jgi:hypothetical protein
MSEKQFIKNRRVDDLAAAPTPQNTPATASTLPTPLSQAPAIPTIREEDGMHPIQLCSSPPSPNPIRKTLLHSDAVHFTNIFTLELCIYTFIVFVFSLFETFVK